MKLAIYGKYTARTDLEFLGRFFDYLENERIEFGIIDEYAAELAEESPELVKKLAAHRFEDKVDTEKFDFALSFGGDGTLLNTATSVGHRAPILGVNFGRLGFLTTIMQDQLFGAVQDLREGIYQIDRRSAITVESSPTPLFEDANFGLNDLTIHKSQTNEMITVHTYINGEFLNTYWADGLIIATPTGSTAYSLSCGGPVIHPMAKNFVITPVAPHSLTVRPMILPDSYVISFEIESRTGHAMIALDTRTELVDQNIEIAVRKADFDIRLVRVAGGNYLGALRNRMMWGKDSRN